MLSPTEAMQEEPVFVPTVAASTISSDPGPTLGSTSRKPTHDQIGNVSRHRHPAVTPSVFFDPSFLQSSTPASASAAVVPSFSFNDSGLVVCRSPTGVDDPNSNDGDDGIGKTSSAPDSDDTPSKADVVPSSFHDSGRGCGNDAEVESESEEEIVQTTAPYSTSLIQESVVISSQVELQV